MFTDDDLKRLKEVINDEEPHPINEYSIFLNALLARLEAAEQVISTPPLGPDYHDALKAWYKARGTVYEKSS